MSVTFVGGWGSTRNVATAFLVEKSIRDASFERVKIHLHSGVYMCHLAFTWHVIIFTCSRLKAMKRAARSPSIPNSILSIANFVATISILGDVRNCGRQLGSTWGVYLCVNTASQGILFRKIWFLTSLGPEQASREGKETSVQKPCVTCLIHYASFRYI